MLKSEFGDIWMLLILLPTSGFSIAQKTKLKTHLKFASLLLITFGCISIFFPYRISTFVMDGFQFLIGRRLPHQIAFLDFWDLAIYLPIGIQNTHLTYGGLLALFLPAVWFHFYRLLRLHLHSKKFNKFPLIIFGIYSILGLLVLLLNQSRSIWIGLITAYILLYKPKSSLNLFKKHKYTLIFSFTILIFLIAVIFQTNWLFRRSIEQLFAKQTLENQRVWIHKANVEIFQNNRIFGIGSGNYTKYFETSYIDQIEKKPYLYYEILITPKGHAHHDFIHFLILGGIIGSGIFLYYWFIIITNLNDSKHKLPIFLGIYAIFIAGMFQCFLLDDEVYLTFLFLVGLNLKKAKSKPIQFFVLICILLPLIISIYSISSLVQNKESDLFIHRTRDLNNLLSPIAQKTINGDIQNIHLTENKEFYFKLEGCLSHKVNLNGNKIPRENPLLLNISLPTDVNDNYPNSLDIELRERDSFDQDQKFKAHSETVINVFKEKLNSGNNLIQVPIPSIKADSEIKFYDLGIRYFFPNQTDAILPIISLNPNCD
ncbi:MAG: O-antigen ligase family protein [Leptospira sp.]|nr:O-antigen ligase family protein [Leptospira sp.]